jgi:tRNA pseudouridine38-40 synthase
MRRVLLTLEYHGGGFYGWQRQGPDRSVQGVVEAAVADLVGHAVSVQSSGRTDRGVHARAMPAHVDIDSRLSPRELMMAINHRLPWDVAVRAVQESDPRFHARFDALDKSYRYAFYLSQARSPLLSDRAHLVPRPLDIPAMEQAAALLVGTHDFAAFRSQAEPDPDPGPERSADTIGPAAIEHGDFEPPPWRRPRPAGTVRTVHRTGLTLRGGVLHFEVNGTGFLRGMVRAMAGSLLQVGLGRQPVEWVRALLENRDRREAGANLPGHGLTLLQVNYPPEPFEGRPGHRG